MLRDGAHTTITTRFPRDAVRRFTSLPDSADWISRLKVVGIDLRDPAQVIGLAEDVAAAGPLDILINNATQTVRRSPGAYQPLVDAELAPLPDGPLPELVTFGHTNDQHPQALARSVTAHPILAAAAARADELTEQAMAPGSSLARAPGHGHRHRRRWTRARPARRELVDAGRRRGRPARDARGPAREHHRAVHPDLEAPSRDGRERGAPHLRGERQRDGRCVRPGLQGTRAPAHEHGEGRREHAHPHECAGDVRDRSHPDDERRHRVDHRRATAPDEGPAGGGGLPRAARPRRRGCTRVRPDRAGRGGRGRVRRVPEGLQAEFLVSSELP
ncbi:hypothetical protein [Sphingomonas sp. LR61]|uniref:hypothetical protein n=1 Tax=Sphingomonas sp. LR61 TaxID=3050234 RepID=UPI003FA73F89